MSHDSDIAETGRFLTELRKERHLKWHEENRKAIVESGISFVDKGEALLFRGKIKADFYPSTGRWRSNNKNYRGMANAFIGWWKKNNK